MAKDYYAILGVDKTASADDLKKAFRKKAHELHPDKTTGDEQKFKEINEAYQVLSDPQKRQRYDQFGSGFDQAGGQGPFGGGFNQGGFNVDFGDLGDIFSDFFGGGKHQRTRVNHGQDIEIAVTIPFLTAVFGGEEIITLRKHVTCDACKGNGAEPGTKVNTCSTCGGSGHVRRNVQTFFGQMESSKLCESCDGLGKLPEKPCSSCRGLGRKTGDVQLKVKIPAGINNNESLKLTGQGEAGERGAHAGDLFVHIRIAPHKFFGRSGNTITTAEVISYPVAALGGKIEVQTVDGPVSLKIPAGTQPGQVFIMQGKGVPFLHKNGRGDQEVTVDVKVPKKLSSKEKELLEEMAKLHGDQRENKKSVWQRVVGE